MGEGEASEGRSLGEGGALEGALFFAEIRVRAAIVRAVTFRAAVFRGRRDIRWEIDRVSEVVFERELGGYFPATTFRAAALQASSFQAGR
jgi:hypothetical protein